MRVVKFQNKIEIEDLQLEVFRILHEILGYAYLKKNGKEYFLKKNFSDYDLIDIKGMRDDLIIYIRNHFDKLEVIGRITKEELQNVICRDKPVTKIYARNYLGYNSGLSEKEYKLENDKFILI